MADFVQRVMQTLDSMDPTIPPSYDSTAPPRPPGYSPSPSQRRLMTEHHFTLASRGASPWATLKLLSRSPNPHQLPTILEGDRLVGVLALDLAQSDSIVAVDIVAKGQVIPGQDDKDPLNFLELKSVLWAKDRGDPHNSSLPAYKLVGHYEWPFTIEIPSSISVPGYAGSFRLPQTFLERRFPTSVQYSLVVHITRSKFRVNSRVQTIFNYIPATRPPSPSPLRQLAYQQGTQLQGPEADPAGWYQLPPLTIRGTAFNKRRVEATCQLSIAKPLSFTRGSQIPCMIHLSSTDWQALDLLSAPRAIAVALRRRLRPIQPASKRSGMFDANADLSADPAENMVFASWWPVIEETANITHRRLEGEIPLPMTLKPSARIAHFAVEYSVELLPFKAIAFTPSPETQGHQSLMRQQVEIVTMNASRSPPPRSYAPPQYSVSQAEAARENYFDADGLGYVWRT
ncbi:hypothetical protein MIND_00267900 [Mycena indigotica]|uniref:Arrestin-like N-terminal domain-containing protein n=1 Tax=Mycena indigotica TaxID=2126181 RepID=A0A8H6T7W1_9AGAR|nr:uncharacterized protein MIND_00267900 [Mycena indigotica]KAF7312540.1 hypothetical protein MIND_00267900 [Mycena indigotica]